MNPQQDISHLVLMSVFLFFVRTTLTMKMNASLMWLSWGNERLYDIMKEKDAIYMKEDFSDEDGVRAAELEGLFAELGGWEAESEASQLLQNLNISEDLHYQNMSELANGDKVKVLLAKALFGKPDVLLLDEPTNGLDIQSISWLEDFLIDFENTVIVVSMTVTS